jgi:membrane protease YdiL (CAAX protease family)
MSTLVQAHPARVTPTGAEVEQHSIVRTVVLHLLPGVLALAIYLITAPLAVALGFPADFAKALFGIPLAVIVFQLAFLLYQGKQQSGQPTLRGIVLYRQPMPLWQYVVFTSLIIGWNALVYAPVAKLTGPVLTRTLFFWLPAMFFTEPDYAQLARSSVLVIFLVQLVVFGAAAVVEELYFRGYLLPRIVRFGWWAPIISTALFAVYHLDQPWSVASVFVGFLPIALLTYWQRNVYLAVISHALVNLIAQCVWMLPFLWQ